MAKIFSFFSLLPGLPLLLLPFLQSEFRSHNTLSPFAANHSIITAAAGLSFVQILCYFRLSFQFVRSKAKQPKNKGKTK